MYAVVAAVHTVRRQCYHILLMRVSEVFTTATQFILSQIVLPFLVVLGVVLGCRDIRYPKVELSSRNTDGIGEVCVGIGPRTPSSRHHTPFSSPYVTPTVENRVEDSLEPDRIAAYSGLKVFKMLLRLWRDFLQYLWSSPSKRRDGGEDNETPPPSHSNSSISDNGDSSIIALHKHVNSSTERSKLSHETKILKGRNVTHDDLKASRQYSGYSTLLSLLGTSLADIVPLLHLYFFSFYLNHSRLHILFSFFFFFFFFFC